MTTSCRHFSKKYNPPIVVFGGSKKKKTSLVYIDDGPIRLLLKEVTKTIYKTPGRKS